MRRIATDIYLRIFISKQKLSSILYNRKKSPKRQSPFYLTLISLANTNGKETSTGCPFFFLFRFFCERTDLFPQQKSNTKVSNSCHWKQICTLRLGFSDKTCRTSAGDTTLSNVNPLFRFHSFGRAILLNQFSFVSSSYSRCIRLSILPLKSYIATQ